MSKFKMGVTTPAGALTTARLGTTGAPLLDADKGKFVKLAADSQFNLCAAGDPIEGQMISRETATQDGFAIGSVKEIGSIAAVCDGLQATPGTGSIAVGDFVVCGTVVAAGTALTAATGPKVCKATNQPGATVTTVDNTKAEIDIALAKITASQAAVAKGLWRVVSVGDAGAVGDTCVIHRVLAP